MTENTDKIFRANMCFIHIFYRKILRSATKSMKVNLDCYGDGALYWMIGTNETNISKYKNGKMFGTTKTMRAKIQNCKPLYKALLGEEQLYPDISLARWERYYEKENVRDIEEQIERLTDNLFKKVCEDKEIKEVYEWVKEKLIEYRNVEQGSHTDIVERAYRGAMKLSFIDYDECDLTVLKKIRGEMKKQMELINIVMNYKERKK